MSTQLQPQTEPQQAPHSQLFTALIIEDEDGGYVAECPQIGTVGQGETPDEALADLSEATRVFLFDFPPPAKSPMIVQFRLDG